MNEKFANHPRLQTVGDKGEVKLPENERVTEELKEKRRKRENIPFYQPSVHYNAQASKDGIKHFVHGLGDTNPLFTDEEYAKKSKYANIIAPGTYLIPYSGIFWLESWPVSTAGMLAVMGMV
jgi:hypothetical protein